MWTLAAVSAKWRYFEVRAKYSIWEWGLITMWRAVIRSEKDKKLYAGLGHTRSEAKANAIKASMK